LQPGREVIDTAAMREFSPSTKPASTDDDFVQSLEVHRTAITGHCYRMLGSASEADDAVQETMLRAWRSADRFEGRASLRTWLYRIATRVCLDALQDRTRRAVPMDLRAVGTIEDPLIELPASQWVEPVPDAAVLPTDADPAERLALRQSVRLAFVATLQHLPPRQRAALLLTEVLGFSAAEAADTLEMTVAAVNSALQRARATLAARNLSDAEEPLSEAQSRLADRFVEAFERYDMDALAGLLRQDATMCMPPFALWLRGHESIRGWMLGRGAACRGSRLVPVAACGGLPAYGQYKPTTPGGPLRPWALVVLQPDGDAIDTMTFFLDTAALFPRFGLPLELPPEA